MFLYQPFKHIFYQFVSFVCKRDFFSLVFGCVLFIDAKHFNRRQVFVAKQINFPVDKIDRYLSYVPGFRFEN